MQTQLRSLIAVALEQAGGYSSDWTPRLGTPICHRKDKKNKKKKKKRKKEREGGKEGGREEGRKKPEEMRAGQQDSGRCGCPAPVLEVLLCIL